MSQKLIHSQEQKQTQTQTQKLTYRQMLQIRLIEMPVTELEESVFAEMYDNVALATDDKSVPETSGDYVSEQGDEEDIDYDAKTEKEERDRALNEALDTIGKDDVLPKNLSIQNNYDAEDEERTYGSKDSFYDVLKEQMNMRVLDDREKYIVEYLICSLDNDGLLRKSPDIIVDELFVYHQLDVTVNEVQRMIKILQDFDPAGIGASDLRECLLLQIDRKEKSEITTLMHKVIANYYDDFMNKHWKKIWQHLNIDEETSDQVLKELVRLNPKPGAALGETEGSKMQQVTPDFIVETSDDGVVTFSINSGRVPELYVSQKYIDMAEEYSANKGNMNRLQKEAYLYAKRKIERAQGFIDAVNSRKHTMYVTMQAIIDIQKKYFQEGDESELVPMKLKDVADRAKVDISTASRVCTMKYAQTRWGIFNLRHFFTSGYVTGDGEELPTRRIKMAIQELVDSEDKKRPLSDQAICREMEKKGLAIARRTVAKYREQLSIPVARLRKDDK